MLDAVHRADLGADIAIDAAFGVNPVLAVRLVEVVDGVGGAGAAAPPAVDAPVLVDYVCHKANFGLPGWRERLRAVAQRAVLAPSAVVAALPAPLLCMLLPTKLAAISRTMAIIFSNSSWAARARSRRHGLISESFSSQ